VWTRDLYQFFGSTIHSITTVVAAYMGGLGLGAYVLGRVADRRANPAAFYGLLEIGIGLFGLASAWVFEGVGASYLAAARWLVPGVWLATAIKFLVAFTVLLVPTFLMGGTLPLLTRAFAGVRLDQFRRQLALFYGINTLGGVVGCALAGYVLIEYVGLRGTLFAVGTVNLLLGAAALMLARGVTPDTLQAEQEDDSSPEPEEEAAISPVVVDEATRRLAIWLIAVTAFASLLYEIAWTRVLVLVVGSSTYAFTTILAAFLAGIGIGSLLAVGKGRPPRELLLGAALIQSAIAVLAALLFPFFRGLPVYIVGTMQVGFLSAVDLLSLHGVAVVAVVLPPAVGMGLCFPLLAELAAGPGGKTGGETGRAYFANTLGSIVGSVLTGFVLIHLLGSERTLVVGVLVNVGAAALMVWWLGRERSGSRSPLQLERIALLIGVLALVITFGTPSWSHRTLDRGPAIYGREHLTRGQLDSFLRGLGAEQLSFEEGWNATVSVWRNGGATWLKTNGKSDASSVSDMNTQVLVGLLPALAHPNPRRAFVVGFGSGVSVRSLADVPGVERVDVVEIERAVLRASRFFDFANRDVLADPKVHVIEDDARSALQLASEPYDIIASEPSNPWIAGVASLFTAEYFRVAASRLNPDGILAQWLQTYRVPPSLVAVVVANVRAVFPHVEIWYSNPSDLIILASRRPIRWNRQRVAGMMASPGPIRTALRDWLRMDRADQLLGHFLLGDRGSAMLAAGATFTHSDNRPALEFVAARHLLVGPQEGTAFDSLLVLKMAAGDTVPSHMDWPVTMDEVLGGYVEALPAYTDLARTLARSLADAAPDDPTRQAGLGLMLFERREYRPAVEHLALALAGRPSDPRLLLASGIAHFGLGDTAAARRLLMRSREAGGDTVFASALLAELAARQGDDSAAAADALRALRGLRPTIATPFPLPLDATLRLLASRARPEVAGEVFEVAAATRPSWDLAYWGGAQVFSRGGQQGCRRAERLARQLSRFGWRDEEIYDLLRACAAGRTD
jgi:predicted membrane-bound spermidine synthase/tetratricopeptide (TPR) repeat protein